jgi:hypothetical protein
VSVMVAEPVQATWQTLSYFYNKSSEFITTQQDHIVNSDYIDKISTYLTKSSKPDYGSVLTKRHSITERLINKISRHQCKSLGILALGIGTSSYVYYKRIYLPSQQALKQPRKKRRAPKLANGARREVVLIIGSPTEPLTRLIALDFEKRGFIVYLTILDSKDFKYVESNPITDDINYLNLTDSFESQISKFQHLLELPVIPFPGAAAHTLKLASVIFAPSLYFPVGPIENMSIATWSRITDRLLLYLRLMSSGLIQLIRNQRSSTILINANIISSLSMPYHAPETIFQNTLKHLFTTLRREISQHGLSVTQVRLGNLHISTQNASSGSKISNMVNSEIRSWNLDIKDLYATNFSKSQFKSNPIKSRGPGTSLRELYHTLFDLIYTKRAPAVIYCGSGARSYDLISRLLPEAWIEWFLK